MGLKLNTAKAQYIKLKEGKFYKPDNLDQGFTELEGTITNMYFKDDVFNGQPIRKLYVAVADESEVSIINMSVNSSNFSSFVNFAKNADLTKPLSLVPVYKMVSKNGVDKPNSSMLIEQNGKFIKSYFTKDSKNGLPEMKQVKINGKIEWDKTDFTEFLENIVTSEFIPVVKGNQDAPVPTRTPAKTPKKTEIPEDLAEDLAEDFDGDLPF